MTRLVVVYLFGAPIAHEDHALWACYTALALQSSVRPYAGEVRRRNGMALQLRVGLNAGEVAVRAIGCDTLEQTIDVRFDLHRVLMQLNEHARTLDQLRAAEPLAQRLGDDQRLGRIAYYLSVYFAAMGEYDRALCELRDGRAARRGFP